MKDYKENGRDFENNVYVGYPRCGDGFTGIHKNLCLINWNY